MDDPRFDHLTRSLVAAASRRRLLAGLIGGLVAGVSVAVPGELALAKKAKKPKKITICFNGQTQTTKKKGFKTRFPGATQGACRTPSPPGPPPPPGQVCGNLGAVCSPSTPGVCCATLGCGHHLNDATGDHCCLPARASCTPGPVTELQCCSGVCSETAGNTCFCKDPGMDCNSNSQCCSGTCLNQKCT